MPSYCTLAPLKELTVNDVRKFDLERRLMYLPHSPLFFVYYATVQGDILGMLRITDYELLFEPLNPAFKGIFSYSNGNLNENCRASFVVNLIDIACKPMSIPCPSLDNDDAEEIGIVMHVQINLKHTGNYYYMGSEAKSIVEQNEQYGIASFHLKGKISAIDGTPWSNEQRRKQAELIVSRIQTKVSDRTGSSSPRESHPSMTSVPFFDIDFSAVLHPHGSTINTKATLKVSLTEVDANLPLFADLFRLNCLRSSITELKNQSFTPLDYIFPQSRSRASSGTSLGLMDEDESEADLLKKSTAQDNKKLSSKRYHIPDEMRETYSEMLPQSEILTVGASKMVVGVHSARKRISESHS